MVSALVYHHLLCSELSNKDCDSRKAAIAINAITLVLYIYIAVIINTVMKSMFMFEFETPKVVLVVLEIDLFFLFYILVTSIALKFQDVAVIFDTLGSHRYYHDDRQSSQCQ